MYQIVAHNILDFLITLESTNYKSPKKFYMPIDTSSDVDVTSDDYIRRVTSRGLRTLTHGLEHGPEQQKVIREKTSQLEGNYLEQGMAIMGLINNHGQLFAGDEHEFTQLAVHLAHNKYHVKITEIWVGRFLSPTPHDPTKLKVDHQFCMLAKSPLPMTQLSQMGNGTLFANKLVEAPYIIDGFFKVACIYHQYNWELRDKARKWQRIGKHIVKNKIRNLPLIESALDFHHRLEQATLNFISPVPGNG